jgi:hypothetical protein
MENISFDITAYMGKQRSGKTISLIRDGYNTLLFIKSEEQRLKKKKTLTISEKNRLKIFSRFELWTNLHLNKKIYGNYKYITPDLIMELYEKKKHIENKLLLFDDIFKDLDSRDFGKKKNKLLSYFTTEVGKKSNILKYVSHFSRNVEIRLRSMTENFCVCKKGKIYKLHLGNKKSFNGIWIEDIDYYEFVTNPNVLKQMVIQIQTYKEEIDFSKDYDLTKKKLYDWSFFYAEKYFKHYDTKEVI